ncbi:hypothetical protein BASA83_010729 [Batrachochytrium salamandrivorans]|nr:hypothetical protein BASA83_010729 [Batrachochytrium salamandrivorans]
MKLAAATLLSLAASVTYASPPAYPENQMDMHYSAFNELISAHMKKRAENRQKFIDILTYPEYLFNKKRPDLVEPSDEALVQLGTTNKNKDDRIKSWEKTEDDKAPHKRPEHESNFYQNRQTEYQKFMQLDNGKRRHSEHIRRLEGKRRHSRLNSN